MISSTTTKNYTDCFGTPVRAVCPCGELKKGNMVRIKFQYTYTYSVIHIHIHIHIHTNKSKKETNKQTNAFYTLTGDRQR